MQDADLETIYKANIPVSHFAGLRGVYDAGFAAGASQQVNATPTAADASAAQVAPTTDPSVTTV